MLFCFLGIKIGPYFTIGFEKTAHTMLHHNLLLIYRNIKRFKHSFFINLIGLSSGLACTLLIYLWVNDERSVDHFHKNDQRLFQVMGNLENEGKVFTQSATPKHLAELLSTEMPEVEMAVTTTPPAWFPKFTLNAQAEPLKGVGKFAGVDFFRLFSYELLQGNKTQVLSDKSAIVISEKLAKSLFNSTENAIGKSLEWDLAGLKKQCTVSGVFKNLPSNASEQFDFVLPFESFLDIIGRGLSWDNLFNTYVVLKKGVDQERFNAKIADYIQRKNPGAKIELFIQPFADNYLYGQYENGVQAGGRIEYVRLFSLIALFILLIACVNFMNLATAKAANRIKEVGIKKAIGARRSTLIWQHLGESTAMTLLSFLVATLLVVLLLPAFNELTGKQLALTWNTNLLLGAFAIAAATSLVAGSYPAFYLSSFKPVAVLKGKLSTSGGELLARKGLVVFQFGISIVFIVAVLVIYQQIEFVQNKNLGYNKNNLLYFEMEGKATTNPEGFLTALRKVPGVESAANMLTNIVVGPGGNMPNIDWKGEKIAFQNVGVSYDMIETLGLEMRSGRPFSRAFSSDTSKLIFNEEAVAVMGLSEPVAGQVIDFAGRKVEILGVVKNFHLQSLHEPVKPFYFRFDRMYAVTVMVRIAAGTEQKTLAGLAQFYKDYNPGFVFDYTFLDQTYQAQYVAEKRVGLLSRYFGALAVLISCLGLFGLAAFTAERRGKEIGIRKVLGASRLLSMDFVRLVMLAMVLALPIAWYLMRAWLAGFAYHIELQSWVFVLAGVAALGIAILTVGYQAIRAAIVNPVDSLRNE